MASKDYRRIGDKKKAILSGITSSRIRSKTLASPSQTRQFLRQYFQNVPVEDLGVDGRWQTKARTNIRDEFYRLRRELAFQLLIPSSKKEPVDIAAAWLKKNAVDVERFTHMIDEMKLRDEIDFATLTVAAKKLRTLISD